MAFLLSDMVDPGRAENGVWDNVVSKSRGGGGVKKLHRPNSKRDFIVFPDANSYGLLEAGSALFTIALHLHNYGRIPRKKSVKIIVVNLTRKA